MRTGAGAGAGEVCRGMPIGGGGKRGLSRGGAVGSAGAEGFGGVDGDGLDGGDAGDGADGDGAGDAEGGNFEGEGEGVAGAVSVAGSLGASAPEPPGAELFAAPLARSYSSIRCSAFCPTGSEGLTWLSARR
jgi:hypothetical protein